jgi:hypothetical protein
MTSAELMATPGHVHQPDRRYGCVDLEVASASPRVAAVRAILEEMLDEGDEVGVTDLRQAPDLYRGAATSPRMRSTSRSWRTMRLKHARCSDPRSLSRYRRPASRTASPRMKHFAAEARRGHRYAASSLRPRGRHRWRRRGARGPLLSGEVAAPAPEQAHRARLDKCSTARRCARGLDGTPRLLLEALR